MCVVDLTEVDSLASTVVAADLGWKLETTPQRDKCSKDLRSCKTEGLDGKSIVPFVLDITESR